MKVYVFSGSFLVNPEGDRLDRGRVCQSCLHIMLSAERTNVSTNIFRVLYLMLLFFSCYRTKMKTKDFRLSWTFVYLVKLSIYVEGKNNLISFTHLSLEWGYASHLLSGFSNLCLILDLTHIIQLQTTFSCKVHVSYHLIHSLDFQLFILSWHPSSKVSLLYLLSYSLNHPHHSTALCQELQSLVLLLT
jgi:hypothetical protein